MSPGHRSDDDFGPSASPALADLAERLGGERPKPGLDFQQRLRATLVAESLAELAPRHIGALIAAFSGGGALLLLIGAAITFL